MQSDERILPSVRSLNSQPALLLLFFTLCLNECAGYSLAWEAYFASMLSEYDEANIPGYLPPLRCFISYRAMLLHEFDFPLPESSH